MGYIPGLDGLRAVAVTLVFLHHTSHLPGWLGSDIFFVVSGYLTTSILLREYEKTDTISLQKFYVRRACRILPALLVVIFAALVLAVLFNARAHDTEVDALFGLLNIINYRYALMSDPTEHWTALSHLWTLSVEGQYYVIWPALLTILLRRGRKVALHVTVAAILAIAAWRGIVFVSSASPYYKIYFSSDTRADELMFGCALALWRTGGFTLRFNVFCQILIFLLAAAGMELEANQSLIPLSFSVIDCAAAGLIVMVSDNKESLITRILSFAPVVAFGRVSYGFYLWHFFIISEPVIYDRLTMGSRTLLTFIVTLALAITSYVLIERPIASAARRWGNARASGDSIATQPIRAEA